MLLVLPFLPAHAALIERDWKTAGDGLLTYDPDTNLEWLDIPISIGFSYDDIVNNELSVGGAFAGFHYAVRDDVESLFENAGIGGINQVPSSIYFNEIITLANLLGGGIVNGQGAMDVTGISGEATSVQNVNWAPFLFWTPDPCINCDPLLVPGEGTAILNGTLATFHSYTDEAGSWLIRESAGPALVSIDIKPGSNTNPVNPRSHGKLTVAILTTEDFDASSVRFGPDAAQPVRYRLDDVDDDMDWDLALKFNTQETGIACGDTKATLIGQTLEGVPITITGTDSIKTVGCKKK